MPGNQFKKNDNSLIGKVYKVRTSSKVIVGSLLLFAGLFMIGFCFLSSGKENGDYALLFWSIIFIVWGCWNLRLWYINRNQRGMLIQVVEDGLYITDKDLNRTRILWSEIREVKQRIVRHYTAFIIPFTTYEFTIITVDGKQLYIDEHVKCIKELGQLIQRKTHELQLPAYINTFNQGETISFGKLSINQFGITKGDANISWKDVKNIEVKDGYVHIFKGRILRWNATPVAEVSNINVFYSLVKNIMAGQKKS